MSLRRDNNPVSDYLTSRMVFNFEENQIKKKKSYNQL